MTASRPVPPAPAAGGAPVRTKDQAGPAPAFPQQSTPAQQGRGPASTGGYRAGPLPTHDVEPDPADGVTEQGAS